VTTFFLVRHGAHDLLGRVLVGRNDVSLNDKGREQAAHVARRLMREEITAVISSPRERTRETAAAITQAVGFPVQIEEALNEVDLGAWTGRSFEELKDEPSWQRWNDARLVARPPGGESMLEVQTRMVGAMETLRRGEPDGRIVLVSHSDPIRAAVLYHLGMSVDEFNRIEISPCGVTTIVVGERGPQIVSLNEIVAS
jgi:broad specificity phosphatase PhoE